ncbi:MAG TPA: hypothetical protein VMV93_12055 [Chloroflexota bacterium]|nr:hypothetical protein [Chloroflexota bacterium]
MAVFPNTRHKVHEAAHFLTLMRLAELPIDGRVPRELAGPRAFKFAFSAFLSAARAVPYSLQEEGASLPGFTRWYVAAREQLLRDDTLTFFGSRSTYRLVFPDEIVDLPVPPTRLTNHQVQPPEAAEGGPTIATTPARGSVTFAARPGMAAADLCTRYLEQLARVTDLACQQLAAAATPS